MRNYQMTVRAEGPIHIGDGGKIGKKEYIFVSNRQQVYVPDMVKMYQFFERQGLLGDYEKYLLEDRRDFAAWLREKKITNPQQFLPWTAYVLDSAGAVVEERGRKEILTFVKDPYGCPYVPGSSLKGMLRTILLSELILQNQGKLADQQKARQADLRLPRTKLLKREIDKLEQKFFYTLNRPGTKFSNKVNDTMSGLRVSDSRPLHTKDLILCQKIDLAVDGRENPLPILRECLRPGTQITFDLTMTEDFPFTARQLMQAAKHCQQAYDQYFVKAFLREAVHRGNGIAYLGGGAGYATKTVVYPLLGVNGVETISKLLSKQFPRHKHNQDIQKDVSPHMLKCARYNKKLYEMGACSIEIKEKL